MSKNKPNWDLLIICFLSILCRHVGILTKSQQIPYTYLVFKSELQFGNPYIDLQIYIIPQIGVISEKCQTFEEKKWNGNKICKATVFPGICDYIGVWEKLSHHRM